MGIKMHDLMGIKAHVLMGIKVRDLWALRCMICGRAVATRHANRMLRAALSGRVVGPNRATQYARKLCTLDSFTCCGPRIRCPAGFQSLAMRLLPMDHALKMYKFSRPVEHKARIINRYKPLLQAAVTNRSPRPDPRDSVNCIIHYIISHIF